MRAEFVRDGLEEASLAVEVFIDGIGHGIDVLRQEPERIASRVVDAFGIIAVGNPPADFFDAVDAAEPRREQYERAD